MYLSSDPVFPNPFVNSFLSSISLDLCWLKIFPDNLNNPNMKIVVTAVGLNVRSSLGLIWFVLKCFPACVRGLKASGSLNTGPTYQDQLHTFIWCHCALPSQTGKTKTDRDTMCFSTSQAVFYFTSDSKITAFQHFAILCFVNILTEVVLFFSFCYSSGFNSPAQKATLLCFLLLSRDYKQEKHYKHTDVAVLLGSTSFRTFCIHI